jgi:hypothetical protein
MSALKTEMFYSRLPVNEIPLKDLLAEEHLFFKVPDDWFVVITDIRRSTRAVEQGLHETVNLLATGCIVAVLNIAHKAQLSIPFFFGGDGATFILPSPILIPTLKALLVHQDHSKQNYDLELRVGSIAVAEIYRQGHDLRLTKFRSSQLFSIPVLLGYGLTYAEKIIKGDGYLLPHEKGLDDDLDLGGMECRWDRIKPPENFDEVVSLLVTAREDIRQSEAFQKVIDILDEVYGEPDRRKPISVPMLKLKATIEKIGQEMRVKFGGTRPLYLINNWVRTLLGTFYFKTKQGKKYLSQLVDLSDTLVIDGKISTVISGTTSQREKLVTALDQLEQAGLINYGFFVSKESVMSCYVRNMNEDHIHFVDGAEGGYTKAAGMLKRKFIPA